MRRIRCFLVFATADANALWITTVSGGQRCWPFSAIAAAWTGPFRGRRYLKFVLAHPTYTMNASATKCHSRLTTAWADVSLSIGLCIVAIPRNQRRDHSYHIETG